MNFIMNKKEEITFYVDMNELIVSLLVEIILELMGSINLLCLIIFLYLINIMFNWFNKSNKSNY